MGTLQHVRLSFSSCASMNAGKDDYASLLTYTSSRRCFNGCAPCHPVHAFQLDLDASGMEMRLLSSFMCHAQIASISRPQRIPCKNSQCRDLKFTSSRQRSLIARTVRYCVEVEKSDMQRSKLHQQFFAFFIPSDLNFLLIVHFIVQSNLVFSYFGRVQSNLVQVGPCLIEV